MTNTRIEGLGKHRATIIFAVGCFLAALALGLVLMVGPARAVDDPPCEIDCGEEPPVNAPPGVSANVELVPAPEGAPAGTSGTYLDPDGNDTVTLSASVGTITKDASGDGTWSWSFLTNDGPSQSQTVTITATDTDNASATDTFTLQVFNLPPSANFNAPSVPINEGSTFFLSLTSPFDQSSVDRAAGFTYSFDCGDGSGFNAFSPSISRPCQVPDDGTRTVKGQIKDKDGGISEFQRTVTIRNVAPRTTLSANNPLFVTEDSAGSHTYNFTVSDPGADTWTSVADCGANGTKLSETATSVTCRFPDGTKTSTVSVTSTDSDSERGAAASQTVNIFNSQPTATFNQSTESINEGGSFELSLTDPSDPSSADTSAGFEYAFDCDGDGTYSDFGTSNSINCSPGSDGPGALNNVGAVIRDKDGDGSTYFGNVSVANVAPTATFNAPNSVEEGRAINLSLTDPSDPSSADTSAGFEYAFDCDGDGTYGAFGFESSASCSAPSAPAQVTVGGKIRDKDEGVSEVYTHSVTITDDVTRPTVLENSLSPARNATLISRTTTLSATFSEPMAAISLEKPDHTSTTFKLQMFNKKTKKWKTIPATVSLSNGNTTATLDPLGATEIGTTENPLAANKKFRGFITGGTNGVKDAQGNPLASNFIWTFNTGG